MRKTTLFIAISLNGKVAEIKNNLSWLSTIDDSTKSEYKNSDFFAGIDTTVMGYKTFNDITSHEISFPFTKKRNYVFTTNQNMMSSDHIQFVKENHIDFFRHLKTEDGLDIWIVGGKELATSLLAEKLIDEIEVFVMSEFFDGVDLFDDYLKGYQLELLDTGGFSNGAHRMRYGINYFKNIK